MTNEEAVRQRLEGVSAPDVSLVTLAYTLAQRIDAGVEDRFLAGLARELRSTMQALTANDRPVDPFDELLAGLSAPVLNPPGPE